MRNSIIASNRFSVTELCSSSGSGSVCGTELDLRTRRLTAAGGQRVELTHAEFALLNAFPGTPERS
jgi:hypothetical protein